LNGLTRRAFAEIVEAGNDDEALAGWIQRETDIAEISVRNVLELRE
jgi:hypothetical protein